MKDAAYAAALVGVLVWMMVLNSAQHAAANREAQTVAEVVKLKASVTGIGVASVGASERIDACLAEAATLKDRADDYERKTQLLRTWQSVLFSQHERKTPTGFGAWR